MTGPPPLQGLRVLELAGLAPTPFAGMLLADYGASVTRIDRPGPSPPPRDTLCRHKRSLVLDLKSPSSLAVLLRLIPHVDILLEPYRPGVLERLGLAPARLLALNPRLIIARLTGFRRDGRWADAAGHDINYLAASGLLSLLGRAGAPPSPPVNVLGDFAGGGLACVLGILLALLRRGVSGRGQVVEANMVDGVAYLATFPRQHVGRTPAWDRARGHNLLDGGAPFYDVYETADPGRYMAVGAQEEKFYAAFVRGMGFAPGELPDRRERRNWGALRGLFERRFREKGWREWRAVFDGDMEACVTPVLRMDEAEKEDGLKGLVGLSESPGLDVSVQEDWPGLEKGKGGEEVLREWLGREAEEVRVDPVTKTAFERAGKARL